MKVTQFSKAMALQAALLMLAPLVHAQPLVKYYFRPGEIYTINTGVGIATQIVISPKERVKDFGTGFSAAWDLVRRDNVFYLKPKDIDADTNMYIRTNKRSYLFDLRVVLKKWKTLEQAKEEGVNYEVTFNYPPEPEETKASVPTREKPEAEVRPVVALRENGNYDYSAATGSEWLIPTKAYDDNKFTYVILSGQSMPGGGMPTIYGKKSEDGEEFLINTKQQGNLITVFGLYDYLVMRHGTSVVGLRRNQP
ncbi:MAG: TrbG/VirB9 family P-type conjugative transfer protein [Pseudomonadota bacterium]|nr:TrbG/VirB9 family P-type conjugative transfer protein [Pseudomonadota bacterium]